MTSTVTVLTTELTTAFNVTGTSAHNESTTSSTTTVATESSIISSASSLSTTSSTTHTYPHSEVPKPNDGLSGGVIAGAVIGGIVAVALIIFLVLFLYRRRRMQQKSNKPMKTVLAPGKDDINKIEDSRRKNEYVSPPNSSSNAKPESFDLYANVNNEGELKDSTDPALDPQGYLKTKAKPQRELGNELYYETNIDKDKQEKLAKATQDEFYVNNETQPLYENKVHGGNKNINESSDGWGGEINSAMTNKLNQVPTGTENNDDYYINPDVSHESEHKSKRKGGSPKDAPSGNKNKHKSDNNRKYQNKAEDKVVNTKTSNDEIDEEYEVPDPVNYPEPKKTKQRTNVKDTKHHKKSKPPVKEVTNPKSNKTKTTKGKDGGKARELKYENVHDGGKYANTGHANEAVSDELYENN